MLCTNKHIKVPEAVPSWCFLCRNMEMEKSQCSVLLLPGRGSPPPSGSAPQMQLEQWLLPSHITHCALVILECSLTKTKKKKKRYLSDLPNFWSYISHKFHINLGVWWHAFGERFPHSGQGWIPVLLVFSDWKQRTLLPFCRFKVNLSALIAVFQLHMRNGETERNQARFMTKTYRYHLEVKFWITSLC